MNNLEGVSVYLSSGIDRVEDDGIVWRKQIKQMCSDKGFGMHFFDPTDKPEGLGSEVGVEKIMVKKLLYDGKWKEAKDYTKQFRRYDLRGAFV